MPFKSGAQRGFLFANHPDVAKKFAAETPKGAKLPYHAAGGGGRKGPLATMFGAKSPRKGGGMMP